MTQTRYKPAFASRRRGARLFTRGELVALVRRALDRVELADEPRALLLRLATEDIDRELEARRREKECRG